MMEEIDPSELDQNVWIKLKDLVMYMEDFFGINLQ